ncbi:hypothetical protein B0H19DRAFT_1247908 [Mycena capillaripes]|nr:hypothetical protein B0H19DRAFT_1247908 [Mycena capillaripes]
MPRVETLLFETFSRSMPRRLLDKLTLPALRRLQVSNNPREPEGAIATIVSLVSRSGCNLQELAFTGVIKKLIASQYCVALPSVTMKFARTLAITEPFFMKWDDGDVTDSWDDVREYSGSAAETSAEEDSEETDSDSEGDEEKSD